MPDEGGVGFGLAVFAAGAADVVVGVEAAEGHAAHVAEVVAGDGGFGGGVDVVLAAEVFLARGLVGFVFRVGAGWPLGVHDAMRMQRSCR